MAMSKRIHLVRTKPEWLEAQGWRAKAYYRERAIYVSKDISGRQTPHATLNAETAQAAVESARERGDPLAQWFWAETVNGKPFTPPE